MMCAECNISRVLFAISIAVHAARMCNVHLPFFQWPIPQENLFANCGCAHQYCILQFSVHMHFGQWKHLRFFVIVLYLSSCVISFVLLYVTRAPHSFPLLFLPFVFDSVAQDINAGKLEINRQRTKRIYLWFLFIIVQNA